MSKVEEEIMLAYLRKMRVEYAKVLPIKLNDIEVAWSLLRQHSWDVTHMHVVHRLVHHLHGSGAIYGFATLSASAQPLDLFVGMLTARETPPSTSEVAELATLVDALRTAINHAIATAEDES